MMVSRYFIALCLGLGVAVVAIVTAWGIRRGEAEALELAPMEQLLEEAGTAADEEVEGGGEVRWDLPVTRNERVEMWIRFLVGRNREKTRLWLERSGRYAPFIRQELRARGMPEDLVYLALIESGFSPRAYSRARAAGLWQFIAETGRRYGLEVSAYVDERRDPIKSTRAALDYLQELYERFGSWYLAAAAYNTGENRVERVLRQRAGGARGDDALFWKIARYLPRETRDYVPLMLAAGHVAKEPEKYGFRGLNYHEPLAFEEVEVPAGTPLRVVAEAAGVAKEEVFELNPHLVTKATPPDRAWPVRIPVGTRAAFVQSFPRVYQQEQLARGRAKEEAARANSSVAIHTVRRGETLSEIALRYGTTVRALRAANGWVRPTRLRVGQRLHIPAARAGVSDGSLASRTPRVRYHRVRRGETLSHIARRYGVTVRQLQAWNGLGRSSLIRAGQRLRILG